MLGSKNRQFNEVFSIAQETLRKTFGMELNELQQPVEEHESAQKEAAKMGLKKKGQILSLLLPNSDVQRGYMTQLRRREQKLTSCALYSIRH